jgi:hypothetical protein
MTADTVPTDPSVLNTTVLSNFAAIDRIGYRRVLWPRKFPILSLRDCENLFVVNP